MSFIIYIYICMLGLAFGSFMSVIVFRLDEKKGMMMGRSECPRCLTRLKWFDLVPLLSFLALRGKCRYCKEKIHFIYPIMELSTASLFILYFVVNGLNLGPESLIELAILFLLLALVFFDFIYLILPDKIIFSALALSLVHAIFYKADSLIGGLLTGLGLLAFFAIIYVVSKGEWMGFGDVKLSFLIGFILGFPLGIFSIIFSIWAGALWGIGLMIVKKANLKTALPFGSFICAISILFIIFDDYFKFFL